MLTSHTASGSASRDFLVNEISTMFSEEKKIGLFKEKNSSCCENMEEIQLLLFLLLGFFPASSTERSLNLKSYDYKEILENNLLPTVQELSHSS